MRELKFRAYCDKYDTKMQRSENYESVGEFFDANPACDHINHMQFTGVKDKNGVDIYEGDILSSIGGVSDLKSVFWHEEYLKYKFNKTSGGLTKFIGSRNEVVGNIYENPELLEANK